MYELFFKSFNEKVSLSEDEQESIKNYLTPKKLRKKQYLLQEGDVCKITAFVEKGSLRAYSVDENGHHLKISCAALPAVPRKKTMTGQPAKYILLLQQQ